MSAQHTPGTWFTCQPYGGTIYIEHRLRGTTLQEVAAVGPTETPEQREANARLIAAAPELLKACQQALYDLKGREHDKYLRDAISKATGSAS